MPYSFTADIEECPSCGADLRPPGSVRVNRHKAHLDDGVVMESGAEDTVLILDSPSPVVRCAACKTDLGEYLSCTEE
jgi:hypothetical protein